MTPQQCDCGTELIAEIATLIINDEECRQLEWASLALVVSITPGRFGMHGFAYLQDGSPVPALPDGDSVADLFDKLHAAMAQPDGARWCACLMQIVRQDAEVDVVFEWEDPARWAVTPANLAQRREELRPVIQ